MTSDKILPQCTERDKVGKTLKRSISFDINVDAHVSFILIKAPGWSALNVTHNMVKVAWKNVSK